MELASRDAELRAALFRLVDVTPACRSLDDLARHLGEYLAEVDDRTPTARRGDARGRLARGPQGARRRRCRRRPAHGAPLHRRRVAAARRSGRCAALHDDGVLTTVDLLGEATVSSAEADRYAERCAEALETLAEAMASWPGAPAAEPVGEGLGAHAGNAAARRPSSGATTPRGGCGRCSRRRATLGAHLHVDMESLDSLETTLELVFGLLDEDEFRDGPSAGLVLQAYLRDSPEELDRILEWARGSNAAPPLVIRLVKGAYWDHEVIEARQHGWNAPVFESKAECDRNFEELTRRLLDARPLVRRGGRLAQPALGRARARVRRRHRSRGPGAARPRRRPRARARAAAGAGARVLPGRRPGRRDGVPRAPAAREHRERVVPARAGARRRRSRSCWRRREAVRQRARARAAASVEPARADRGARAPRRAASARGARPRRRGRGRGGGLRVDRPGHAAPDRRGRGPRRAPTRRTPRSRRRRPPRPPGPRRRPRSGRRSWCAPRTSCAATGWTWPRSRCASARSRGPRPTPTSARRSTSSSTTRARRSSSTAGPSSCRCRASATRCATWRAASRR